MTANLLVQAASMLLALAFALRLGAQTFDSFVNQPVFLSEPPDSIRKYLEYATARRVPAYFMRVGILVIVATLAAIVACVAMRGPTALLVSTACAVSYIALIFLFFIPTNRKLGLLPAAHGRTNYRAAVAAMANMGSGPHRRSVRGSVLGRARLFRPKMKARMM